MRIKLIVILFVLIFTTCSNNDNIEEGSSPSSVESLSEYYLCVDIATPSVSYTRASDYPYQPGSEEENQINSVRFYFFDDNGDAVKVSKRSENVIGNPEYFYEVAPEDSSAESNGSADQNIEKTFSALLSLKFDGGKLATRLVAIVNPDDNIKKLTDNEKGQPAIVPFTLSTLQNAVLDFKSEWTSSKGFVMTNSTYVDPNPLIEDDVESRRNKIICPVTIKSENLAATEERAKENKIEIYVERVLARLDVAFKETLKVKWDEKAGGIKTGLNYKSSGGDEKDIYVKFLGWAVTSTPNKSRLLKMVDDTWDPTTFFSSHTSWNNKDDHRSLWAINPELTTNDYQWYNFKDLTGIGEEGYDPKNKNQDCFEIDIAKGVKTYLHENANPYNTGTVPVASPDISYRTKAIFAAQLVDSDGKPVEFAEYESQQYAIDGLKNMIANSLDMFREAKDNETADLLGKFIKIRPSDIDFETSMQHEGGETGPESEGTYYVYFKLKELKDSNGNIIEWYHKFDSIEEMSSKKISDPNKYIESMTFPAKVWRNGYCYYYFDIPHCQQILEKGDPGYFGVVRNTLYNATIDDITALGTPVYDPEEVIYPETPEKTGNQLKITVNNVLWHLVDEDLQLSW